MWVLVVMACFGKHTYCENSFVRYPSAEECAIAVEAADAARNAQAFCIDSRYIIFAE